MPALRLPFIGCGRTGAHALAASEYSHLMAARFHVSMPTFLG
jgi:hypothetical protein